MSQQQFLTFVARLLALHNVVQESEYLLINEHTHIGRADWAEIVLEPNTISYLHAVIERRGSIFILRNVSGTNPTLVNGLPIEGEYILRHNDEIGIADTVNLFRFVDRDSTVKPTVKVDKSHLASEILSYDAQKLSFLARGTRLDLSLLQLRLLHHLYLHTGNVCARAECEAAVWGDSDSSSRDKGDLDRLLFLLRQRLEQAGVDGNIIQNERGIGYKLVV